MSWLEAVRPFVRKDDFFVNIGANDGVANDPVHPFLQQHGWRGIAVEPVPWVFEQLRSNLAGYEGVTVEQVALAAEPGQRALDHFPESVGQQFFWAGQLGTLRAGHLPWVVDRLRLFRRAGVPDDLEQQIVTTTVPCTTFDALMAKHGVERVDFLNVDAEGSDYEILGSIDLQRWRPRVLCIESSVMSRLEQGRLLLRLADHGYSFLTKAGSFTEVFVLREEGGAGDGARPPVERVAAVGADQLGVRPVRELDGVRFTASPDDEIYRCLCASEAHFWQTTDLDVQAVDAALPEPVKAVLNEGLTGDGGSTWYQDLGARGPFGTVALLGATGGYLESGLLSSGGAERLDVFDLSPGLLARTYERVSAAGFEGRIRLFAQDLNTAPLPRARYDLVLSCNSLNHLCELEWALDSIRAALRPGGALALYEWVGETRMRFSPERREVLAAVLREIPPDYKFLQLERMESPIPEQISAFQAVSSAEVLPRLERDFEVLHHGMGGVAQPALLLAQWAQLASEAPDVLARVVEGVRAAEQSGVPGGFAFAMLRPKASG